MFIFPQSVNPVLGSHLDSQMAFFNDVSRSLSGSFQHLCKANLKLSQAMLEESLNAGRRMLSTEHAADVVGSVTSGAHPVSEALRAYQQHIARLAADAQVDLARVTQQHGQETSHTAHALAEEVERAARDSAERHAREQEATLKNFRDPFQQDGPQRGNGMHTKAGPRSVREGAGDGPGAGASMQFDGLADNAASHGNVQGPVTQPTQQSGNKNSSKPA